MADNNKKQKHTNIVNSVVDDIASPAYTISAVVEGVNRKMSLKEISDNFDELYVDAKKRSRLIPGYKYAKNENGDYYVLDVDENGNPNKHSYIGSNAKTSHKQNEEVRAKYWANNPVMRHATDSIGIAYGMSGETLRHRLDMEGFTDKSIRLNNKGLDSHSYNALNTNYNWTDKNKNPKSPGFSGFGLDDSADMIRKGQAKLINENWSESYNTNEKGRTVHTADGDSNKSNMGIMASVLRHFKEQAAKDYPNADRMTLEDISSVYYNRGRAGGKKWINAGNNPKNYKQ